MDSKAAPQSGVRRVAAVGPAVHPYDASYLNRVAESDYGTDLSLRIAFLYGAFKRCVGRELRAFEDTPKGEAIRAGDRIAAAWLTSPERVMARTLFEVHEATARDLATVREIRRAVG